MPPLTKTLASLLVLSAVAGCGGASGGTSPGGESRTREDAENSVRFVMSDLQAASRDGDGDRICNRIFTRKLADSVTEASTTGDCAKEVKEKLFSPDVRIIVENVKVTDAANATATVREQNGRVSRVFLAKQGGEWRVRSVQAA